MALENWINASKSLIFRDKVSHHVMESAQAILGEAVVAPMTVTQHRKRVDLARRVTAGNTPEGFYTGVAVNATIRTKIDAGTNYDSDLAFVVNSIWDDVAGYDAAVDEPAP